MGGVKVGWWRALSPRRRWGALLTVLGVGLTVLLAYLGSSSDPPAASTQALTALLAILAQGGAALVFSGEGRADPTLAQRSVARLVNLAQRASTARATAEAMTEGQLNPTQLRRGAGELSVHLSYLEEGYIESIEDWRMFHSRAVEQAEGRVTRDGA